MVQDILKGFSLCHIDSNIHNILKERRVILGLTQQQVADKAKIIVQQYQKLESGERKIMSASFNIACRVIEALEMNVSDFYHGKYMLGEEIYSSKEGLRYKKTGKLINEDVV